MSKGGVFGATVLLSLFSHAAFADPPPIDAYAALQVSSPRLSPDGNSIAMIGVYEGRQALMVRTLGDNHLTLIPTADYFPNWFAWKNSDRLLASLRYTARLHFANAARETRLMFLDADGGKVTPVKFNRFSSTGSILVGQRPNTAPQTQDRVVSLLPDDPDHILMAVTPLDDYLHPELVQVDIHDGQPRTVLKRSDKIVDYFSDSAGSARAAVGYSRPDWVSSDTDRTILVRDGQDAPWVTLYEGDYNHPQGNKMRIVGFNHATPDLLYVTTEEPGGKRQPRTYDIPRRSLGPPLVPGAECDVHSLVHDGDVVGFFIPCQDSKSLYFDPGWQHDWEVLTRALHTNLVTILDKSIEGKRTLAVVQETPSSPDSFWLIDRRGPKTDVRLIGEAYRTVPREEVAETKEVSYRARDGLTIPALLTLPVRPAPGPLPFVVFPHGGPTAPDEIEFDWIVQFLASRGYGVLQPQFRGSTGFGAAFEEAGLGQWGLAMQDDVTDGTKWLIEQKIAQQGRICIAGGSYGGYAALMGVIKEPDLYACAAAFAPVADMNKFIGSLTQSLFNDINLPRVLDAKQDSDAISPVENAAKIKVPVLLMHGRKDYTVEVEQSEAMERALKRAGKPVEAIYLEGADHYFSQGSDRTAWLTALEKLLSSTIGTQH